VSCVCSALLLLSSSSSSFLNQGIGERKNNKNNGMCYFKYFLYCKLIVFRLLSWLQGESFIPYEVQWDMLVPGIFLIGATFKSPELNDFPKLQLLKTLLSFSRPWAPTSVSVKK
jgi:hypothetical protein